MDESTHGAMFTPVILGSDKTTVSVATGQNDYYPLYISLGNVHNCAQRAHRNAVSLITFLSIPKGKCIFIKYLFPPSNPLKLQRITQIKLTSGSFAGSYSTRHSTIFSLPFAHI